jgi:hypothetical protein
MNLKCDYCGYFLYASQTHYKPGDGCPKCGRGVMCEKGSRGNP